MNNLMCIYIYIDTHTYAYEYITNDGNSLETTRKLYKGSERLYACIAHTEKDFT